MQPKKKSSGRGRGGRSRNNGEMRGKEEDGQVFAERKEAKEKRRENKNKSRDNAPREQKRENFKEKKEEFKGGNKDNFKRDRKPSGDFKREGKSREDFEKGRKPRRERTEKIDSFGERAPRKRNDDKLKKDVSFKPKQGKTRSDKKTSFSGKKSVRGNR